jgi:hypothetical protein
MIGMVPAAAEVVAGTNNYELVLVDITVTFAVSYTPHSN